MEMVTRWFIVPCLSVLTLTLVGCSGTPSHSSSSRIDYELPATPVSNKEARQLIMKEAAAQLGKPYKLSGNSPREGFDCSGLVFYTHLKAGKLLPRRSEDQYLSANKVTQIKPGDLVFFSTDSQGKHIDHVGIYLGNEQFIHAPGKGRTITTTKLTESYWQRRFIGAGSYFD